ncbi:MAG: hypothetical protein PVI97_11110 [Candidatus Thiodiazotropha sp.]|jgi:hypothetical protein
MNDDIYKPPSADLFDHVDTLKEEVDDQAKVLASGFRMVLYGLYMLLASILFIVYDEHVIGAVFFAAGAWQFVFGIISIGIGEKNSVLLGLLYLCLCIIPIFNIISLIVILKRAANGLKDNSYQIRVYGVRKLLDQ